MKIVDDEYLEYVEGKSTAYEMWTALQQAFARKEKMDKHFLRFDKTIRDLKSAGATVEEMDIINHAKKKKNNLQKGANVADTTLNDSDPGKQTCVPHVKPRTRATRILQLIHSDVMGPISPTSYDSKRYVVTFIDDWSHFTAAYIMKYKSETLLYFKAFETMATAHFGTKISRLRCDQGGEYVSKDF
ncbi:hypothetical protein ILUMI_15277, partial [Ignelater luminosus]